MEINWRAVLTGFVVAVALGFAVAWIVPADATSSLIQALPGLIGGFVAGYMAVGTGRGAVHGGLATIVGALVVLVAIAAGGALFVGLVPATAGFTVALVILLAQAIPGALAGAVGGWLHKRSQRRERAPTGV